MHILRPVSADAGRLLFPILEVGAVLKKSLILPISIVLLYTVALLSNPLEQAL